MPPPKLSTGAAPNSNEQQGTFAVLLPITSRGSSLTGLQQRLRAFFSSLFATTPDFPGRVRLFLGVDTTDITLLSLLFPTSAVPASACAEASAATGTANLTEGALGASPGTEQNMSDAATLRRLLGLEEGSEFELSLIHI